MGNNVKELRTILADRGPANSSSMSAHCIDFARRRLKYAAELVGGGRLISFTIAN